MEYKLICDRGTNVRTSKVAVDPPPTDTSSTISQLLILNDDTKQDTFPPTVGVRNHAASTGISSTRDPESTLLCQTFVNDGVLGGDVCLLLVNKHCYHHGG